MNAFIAHHRFFACLMAAFLALNCLVAEKPRYPDLSDPFGPRHGPPPMERGEGDHNRPPPPPRPDSRGESMNASELIDDLETVESNDETTESPVSLDQLRALERFLEMPPEQLARIRETIERVEAMPEEEKQALREKIQTFRHMEEEKIKKLRDIHRIWKDVPREERRLVHRYMMSMPKEEANAIRREIASLPREEFHDYFEGMLANAREAEAAGELPTLPESVRRWRRDKEKHADPSDPHSPDRLNTRRDRPE